MAKKREPGRQARRSGFKEPYPESYLIVTEGQKTEPNYFQGLIRHIQQKCGGNNIAVKPLITVSGQGKNTISLANAVDEVVSRQKLFYENIWVLFDKDDFTEFDQAIHLAQSKGYRVGWSNQSFEYWLLLHFTYTDADLHRDQLNQKLDMLFKQNHLCAQGYAKNDSEIFAHVSINDGLSKAIINGQKIHKCYSSDLKPSLCAPCTTVYLLVKELKEKYLDS